MYRTIRNILIFVAFLFINFISTENSFSQSEEKKKAIWIVQNFASNVEWTNEENIDKFIIGIYGSNTLLIQEFENLSKIRKIKNKPFSVINFKKTKDIQPTQILFVENSYNDEIKNIFENTTKNTLIVTDQCPDKSYIMINLLPLNEGTKRFELNTSNANEAGITLLKELLKYGGTEVELRGLYSATEKALKKEKEKLEMQRAELEQQTRELMRLKEDNKKERLENEKQKEINKKQKDEIDAQKEELAIQEIKLSDIQDNLSIQQEKLAFNNKTLENQEGKIKEQTDKVNKLNEETKIQLAILEKARAEIQNKDVAIGEQNVLIEFQRTILFIFIALTVLVLVLAFFTWRSSRLRKKINDELRTKNIAIYKQKEEIENQQKQTEILNIELEKLSIVASKTENAVTIMDENGNFEWVNVGFTRMYGYTLQLLTHELDDNIVGASNNPDIENIIEKCKREKKSIVYESLNKTRTGDDIWVQTSLTPIVSEEGNIRKLITIETDISRIKKAENEIRKQHEKILEQSHLLEATNKELEKLSLVASETDNAISIMDAAGNYQWINDGYSRLFEYSFTQLVTEYSRNLISNETNDDIKEIIKRSIEEKIPVTYDLLKTTRSGKEVWVQTTLTPVIDKENNIKSLISISSDISELKRAEQAIRQQSEELLAQKEELVYQNDRIELQNQNITASISYAKTIQSAILPPKNILEDAFKGFVIYKPKDIVSGDFYWFARLPAKEGLSEKFYYAVVDCTGHGVPGAFMSMIGSRLLNEIVNEKKVVEPSNILDLMNNGIKSILRQDQTDNNDGMDVCLIKLEKQENNKIELVYAGAKRPLYFYSQEERKLKYIKGTRKTIGGTQTKRNKEVFEDNKVCLNHGDKVYLSTDGIIDQSSAERIRFGSLRLIELLKKVGHQSLYEQENAILNSLQEYQGDEKQRDDITFMAIEV
ncbi:MAG: DUF4154 domain-containing protein [Bacteroidales bacterium]|nr:DUF4154 domain-containing protein [Bacteroidales bacterium]MBN2758004.1 DUF4154 domain-containing protein [Bacteroidales bacterium]